MYCRNCGNKVDENAYICVNCGVILKKDNNTNNRTIIKKNNSNGLGLISIILGIISIILSLSYFFIDISEVGMYTTIYERLFYAIGFTFPAIVFTIVSFALALVKKNKSCNQVGLSLSLIAAFLIITEFMVIIIY